MKLFLFKRKILVICACLIAAAAMFLLVNVPAIVSASDSDRQRPIYCVQRDQKMISI